jgi:putative endonuclease
VTFVYIIECADGTYYTGWTTDLNRRVAAHNAGRGSRYTSSRRPVKLVYWEEHPDRRTAQRRELALKRMRRARKTSLISDFNQRDVARSPIPDG